MTRVGAVVGMGTGVRALGVCATYCNATDMSLDSRSIWKRGAKDARDVQVS